MRRPSSRVGSFSIVYSPMRPGLEGGPFLGLEGAGGDAVGGVEGQVAEVDEAPEGELRRAAVLRVRPHLVGEPEARTP